MKIGTFYSYSPTEELEDPYYLCIRLAIEKKIEEEGYKRQNVSSYDTAETLAGVDGIICTGTFSKAMVECIDSWDKPVVFIDACPDWRKFDSIVIDYEQAVAEILDYLIGKGHTKIGFIGGTEEGEEESNLPDERAITFKDYLMKKGLFCPEYVKTGPYHARYGYKLFKELYEEGNMPTAVFVSNDSIATGAYRAAYELGLSIPNDISIVGFNDLPTAKYMVPPLTTMRLYMEFMGEYAVSMLEERVLKGRDRCLKVIVPTKLYARDSVKDINEDN